MRGGAYGCIFVSYAWAAHDCDGVFGRGDGDDYQLRGGEERRDSEVQLSRDEHGGGAVITSKLQCRGSPAV